MVSSLLTVVVIPVCVSRLVVVVVVARAIDAGTDALFDSGDHYCNDYDNRDADDCDRDPGRKAATLAEAAAALTRLPALSFRLRVA